MTIGITRRGCLKVGALGSVALLAGAGVWLFRAKSKLEPRIEKLSSRLRVLNAEELQVLDAAVQRLLRSEKDVFPDPRTLEIALRMDASLADTSAEDQKNFKRLVRFLERVAPWLSGQLSPFTRLDGQGQDQVLHRMMTSRVDGLRGGFEALKTLAALAYFSQPETWSKLGYDGPLLNRPISGWHS